MWNNSHKGSRDRLAYPHVQQVDAKVTGLFMSSLGSRRQRGRVGQGPALTHPVVGLRRPLTAWRVC